MAKAHGVTFIYEWFNGSRFDGIILWRLDADQFNGQQCNTYSKKLCNVIENVLNYKNKAKKENISEKGKVRVIDPIRQMESSN
jgi:hypothetical protein